MKVTGTCHCGEIRFTAKVDPETVTICHCTDCQTLSGTAFRVIAFARRHDVTLITGRPSTYDKRADSGATRRLAFCPTCGASLWSTDANNPDADFGIRTGVLDARAKLPPQSQSWTGSALPWLGDWPDLTVPNRR